MFKGLGQLGDMAKNDETGSGNAAEDAGFSERAR